jgi:hypothetical protein
MKHLSIPLKATMALLTIIVMTACVPGQPTPSADEIAAAIETAVAETVEAQGQVATSVALTVAAREAEADAAATAAEPAFTPTPLPTLTPVLPTATPLTISGGGGGSSGGGGGGSSSYAYSCDIIHQRPQDNTEFKRTNTFDVRFAILNTGTATWEKGKDLVLLADHGALVVPFTMMELPYDLKPGEYWEIGPFDAVAPNDPGHYVIDFKLEGGFCYPYVAFDVVR